MTTTRYRATKATYLWAGLSLLWLWLAACAARAPIAPASEQPAPVLSAAGSVPPAAAVPLIPIPHAAQPLPQLLTGGQPTAEDLLAARQAGYRTVISLLEEVGDEPARAEALGLVFVSIPIRGPADLTEDAAHKLGAAMNAPSSAPWIVHCASGNRAGALLALKAFFVDGMTRDAALAFGTSAGMTTLRPSVEERLSGAVIQ
jgi:protein tyrosine phosphatase (PTP) superfamily phosphohydrolase (DUF442 family)